MDNIKDFFEYATSKFWVAVIIVIGVHFIPFGEEYLAMVLFKEMWAETKSIHFLMGMLAVEFIIILVPFVGVQRFLSEKCCFK
jgi:hypothetical protein